MEAVLESTERTLAVAKEQLVESNSAVVGKFFLYSEFISLVISLREPLNMLTPAIDAVTRMVNAH
jgi:hypothetical protein